MDFLLLPAKEPSPMSEIPPSATITALVEDAVRRSVAESFQAQKNELAGLEQQLEHKIQDLKNVVSTVSRDVEALKTLMSARSMNTSANLDVTPRTQVFAPSINALGHGTPVSVPTISNAGNPNNGNDTPSKSGQDAKFKDTCREAAKAYLDLTVPWGSQKETQRREALRVVQEAYPQMNPDLIKGRFRKYLTNVKSYHKKQDGDMVGDIKLKTKLDTNSPLTPQMSVSTQVTPAPSPISTTVVAPNPNVVAQPTILPVLTGDNVMLGSMDMDKRKRPDDITTSPKGGRKRPKNESPQQP